MQTPRALFATCSFSSEDGLNVPTISFSEVAPAEAMSFAHGDMRGERQTSTAIPHPPETSHAPGPASMVPTSIDPQSRLVIRSAGLALHDLVLTSTRLRSRRSSSSWMRLAGMCIGADARHVCERCEHPGGTAPTYRDPFGGDQAGQVVSRCPARAVKRALVIC